MACEERVDRVDIALTGALDQDRRLTVGASVVLYRDSRVATLLGRHGQCIGY